MVNRALRICSVEKLSGELDLLGDMFLRNGYSAGIMSNHLTTDSTIGCNLDRDGANCCILRLPYVGAHNMYIERRARSVVGRAFGEVNVVTVYVARRASMAKKDILSTTFFSKLIYSFECRFCDSRYLGRTIQHLHARIRQNVPLHLLPPGARKDRQQRGRPPKVHATRIDTGEGVIEHQATGMRQLRRSARIAALKESAWSTGISTNSNTALRSSSSSEYQSAIAND